MTHAEKLERLRTGYEAFSKGDLETIRELLAPDVVWHVGGHNPITGEYKGIEETFGLFGKLFEMTEGTFHQEVHDLLASDDHLVAITRATARRPDGRTLDMDQVGIYHTDDEGRVTESWLLPQDQKAADEFFA